MTDAKSDAPERHRMRRKRLGLSRVARIVTIQVVLVVALGCWLLAGQPIGIPGAWAWEVRPKPLLMGTLLRVVILGAAVIGLGWLGLQRIKSDRRSDAGVIAGLILLTLCLQLIVLSLAPQAGFTLIAATASRVSTEYFEVASDINDPLRFTRDYAAEMTRGHHHVATHPPGAVIFYWLCLKLYRSVLFPAHLFDKLTEFIVGAPAAAIAQAAGRFPEVSLAPDGVGASLFCCLVLGVCGALSLVPLFHLAREAAGREVALISCTLFAISPAPVLFFQGLDSLMLLLAVGALALAYAAFQRQKLLPATAAGLVIGLATLVSFGSIGAGGIPVFVGILLAFRPRRRRRQFICRALAVYLGAWTGVLLVGHLLCGMKLHVIFRQALAAHRMFTWIGFGRTYETWIVLNVIEFACFFGLPSCVMLVVALGQAARGGWLRMSHADLIGLAGLAMFVLLDASGSVRGEVGRLWLFIMPPLMLWVGNRLDKAAGRKAHLTFWTIGLTLAQLIILGLALTPVVMPF